MLHSHIFFLGTFPMLWDQCFSSSRAVCILTCMFAIVSEAVGTISMAK